MTENVNTEVNLLSARKEAKRMLKQSIRREVTLDVVVREFLLENVPCKLKLEERNLPFYLCISVGEYLCEGRTAFQAVRTPHAKTLSQGQQNLAPSGTFTTAFVT